jgi:hypothetical protein
MSGRVAGRAHPSEKTASGFVDAGIHRLYLSRLKLLAPCAAGFHVANSLTLATFTL